MYPARLFRRAGAQGGPSEGVRLGLGGTVRSPRRHPRGTDPTAVAARGCRPSGMLLAWTASSWCREAYAFLVGAPVFKTGEGRYPVLAGSIPVRLR